MDEEVEYGQFSARLDVRMIHLLNQLAAATGRSRNKQLEFIVNDYVVRNMPRTYELGDDVLVDASGHVITDSEKLRSASRGLGGDFGGVLRADQEERLRYRDERDLYRHLDQALRLLASACGVDPDDVGLVSEYAGPAQDEEDGHE